jgi:hypothetical protein
MGLSWGCCGVYEVLRMLPQGCRGAANANANANALVIECFHKKYLIVDTVRYKLSPQEGGVGAQSRPAGTASLVRSAPTYWFTRFS